MVAVVSPKVHNAPSAVAAKVTIRERVLAAVTPEQAVVFDAFCGPGAMYDAVWKGAAGYVGCDETWFRDDRLVYVADNCRLLRCLDLQPFTVFDLDAFGSPWEQAVIVAARRRLEPGERVGVLLTEGDWKNTRLNGLGSYAMRQAAGITREMRVSSVSRFWDVSDRALRNVVRQMGGTIVRHWRAHGVTGSRVRYTGVVIERAA